MEAMVNQEFWKGRRVLITGHTGFKGSWLSMLLNFFGAKVGGYALDPPTNPSLFELCNIKSFVESTISDIRDFNSVLAAIEKFKPEIVIHMAAQPIVRLSYSDPILTYQTNVMGTVNLFEAIRISKVKSVKAVLNITTDKCYENKEWIWPYREHERLGGYDPYSNSKACSELVTSAYRDSFFNLDKYTEHGIAIATARAGNVIGGGDWAQDRLIPDFVKAISENRKIIIRNPDAIRPWQHVLEPLTGYLILCEHLYMNPLNFSGAWNFGPNNEDVKTVKWIIDKLFSLWNKDADYEIDSGNHPHEATFLRLDNTKARSYLNWNPRWNIATTLKSIVEMTDSYLNNSNLFAVCNRQIQEYFLSN